MNQKDKELTIRLPEKLLKELDIYSTLENKNRNQFLQDAIREIVCKRNRDHLYETMRIGYEEMGAINLALAELGVCIEQSLLEDYELNWTDWKRGSW